MTRFFYQPTQPERVYIGDFWFQPTTNRFHVCVGTHPTQFHLLNPSAPLAAFSTLALTNLDTQIVGVAVETLVAGSSLSFLAGALPPDTLLGIDFSGEIAVQGADPASLLSWNTVAIVGESPVYTPILSATIGEAIAATIGFHGAIRLLNQGPDENVLTLSLRLLGGSDLGGDAESAVTLDFTAPVDFALTLTPGAATDDWTFRLWHVWTQQAS